MTALGPADHQHALPFKTLIQSRLLGPWPGEGCGDKRNPHKAALGVSFKPARGALERGQDSRKHQLPKPGNTADERAARGGPGRWGARRKELRPCSEHAGAAGGRAQEERRPSFQKEAGARMGQGGTPTHGGKFPAD